MRNKSIFAALALLLGFAAVAGCLSTDDLLRGAANLYGVDPSLVDEYLNGNIDPNDYIDAGGGIEGLRSFLPTSITLDVDDLPTGESERQLATAYRGLAGGARDIVDMFQNASQIVLDIGETVNADLTDPAQTTVEGTFELNGTTLGYKCDFAAYDFDGDGAADGSGNSQTAPWPIASGRITAMDTNR